MSPASQRPASRAGATRSRPVNRSAAGRESDRIKSPRAGWASPTTAVSTFWRSGPLPVPVAGLAAGVWAAVAGLAVTVVLTMVVWIFAAGESASDTAMRVGADIWLVAHGTPFVVDTGVWSLLPWAWIVFPCIMLWAAGRWVAHRAAVAYAKSAVVAAGCMAGAYALIALLAALYGTLSGVAAVPGRAALHAGLLAFLVGGASIAHRARLGVDAARRAWIWARPAAGALATLIAGAGVVYIGALLVGHSAITSTWEQLRPGVVGGSAVLVAWLGFLPAALMWALSFAVGTGVTVAGTAVTPVTPLADRVDLLGVQLLPTTAQPWWLAGVLIPLAAGAVLTRLCGPSATVREWLLPRAAALAIVLIAVDLWWAISAGSLGTGRLNLLGPPPAVIAVLVGGIALGILLEIAGVWVWRRWRHHDVIDLTDECAATEDIPD